ncbi:MAG: hypothetical protein HC905_12195 [Bacteroidales bacterium]|nr:hypothetical protein [Bacteroidales bacterium]
MPELENSLNVYSQNVNLNNQQVSLIVAPTKSNTIGMYIYDQLTGKNLLTKFIGDRYPIEPAAVKQDSEGSVILLARIFESGKYPRISLIKFDKSEFKW